MDPAPDSEEELRNIVKWPIPPSLTVFPISFAPIPDEFFSYITHITTGWGIYEKRFNNILCAMVAYNGSKHRNGWLYVSYEQRCGMFRDEAAKAFVTTPFMIHKFNYHLDQSLEVQRLRNLLVHSHIHLDVKPSFDFTLIASGRQKGQNITKHFKINDVIDLYRRVGELNGTFLHIETMDPGLRVTSQDIPQLQAVLAHSPRAHSNPSTP